MVEIAQNLFSTRRGSVLVGAAAAVVAGIVLVVYLHQYRNSVNSTQAPAAVLVASQLIPKGTPGDLVGSSSQFQVGSVPKAQLAVGALTDPAALTGRIAVRDIYAGQQLTAADFLYTSPDALQNKISGTDRAMNVSIDPQHGMIGLIGNGDRIDIFVGLNKLGTNGGEPVIKLLLSNVLVLRAPLGGGGMYTLRVPQAQAAWLSYAADNGRLWFVLRPASGAKVQNPGYITARTLLLGYKAVR
jgi:Flp pilus assembly protein CpaB